MDCPSQPPQFSTGDEDVPALSQVAVPGGQIPAANLPGWIDRFQPEDVFLADLLPTVLGHLGGQKGVEVDTWCPHYLVAGDSHGQQARASGPASGRLGASGPASGWLGAGGPASWPARREYTAERLQLTDTRRAVVVMIDGFGAQAVADYAAYLPFLRQRRSDLVAAKTIVPSTTAAAITAFTTSALPGATRMVGWSIAQGDSAVDLLSFAGAQLPGRERQRVDTLFERATAVGIETVAVNATRFVASGLTQAALRGAQYLSADSLQARVDAAVQASRAGADLVYLYWHGLDHAGHGEGVGSQAWLEALEEVDQALSQLAARVGAGTAVIVTADHGMVNSEPSRRLDIAQIPQLREGVRILAGEGRAPHIHPQDGQAQAVVERWREYLGERAFIVPAAQLPAYFGPGPGNGDVGAAVAFMAQDWTVGDSRTQRATTLALPGVHGSLTNTERAIVTGRIA